MNASTALRLDGEKRPCHVLLLNPTPYIYTDSILLYKETYPSRVCVYYIYIFFSFPPVHLNESNLKSKPRGGRWYLQGTGPQFFFSPPRHITYSKEGSVCKFLCVCGCVPARTLPFDKKKKSESSPFPDWNAGGFSALWRENIKSSSVAHIRFFFSFSRCCCFGVVVCRCQVRSRARRIPPSWNVSPLVSPISWRGDSRPQWKEPRKTTERAATYSSKKRERTILITNKRAIWGSRSGRVSGHLGRPRVHIKKSSQPVVFLWCAESGKNSMATIVSTTSSCRPQKKKSKKIELNI